MNDRNSNKPHRVIVLTSLLKAVEQGDSEAQYNIGIMYLKGRGTSQNPQKAMEWYQKAAEQGLPEAKKLLQHLMG